MTRKQACIGALVIGQAPRPDLVRPLQANYPEAEIITAGALDGLSAVDIPAHQGDYPLSTRLRSGKQVMVEESFLIGRLQHTIKRLEQQEPNVMILLCAGTFAALTSNRPLLKPFDIGKDRFSQAAWERIGFITPIAEQIPPITARWANAGFHPTVWSDSLAHQNQAFYDKINQHIQTHQLQALALDYVGHPVTQVNQLRQASPIPVVDLGQEAINALSPYLFPATR